MEQQSHFRAQVAHLCSDQLQFLQPPTRKTLAPRAIAIAAAAPTSEPPVIAAG